MVQIKCKGCKRYFIGSRGLSNHFHSNKECKVIHLNLIQQYRVFPNIETQVDNDSKMKAVSESHTLKTNQCQPNQDINDSCNINQDSIIEDDTIEIAHFASLPSEEEEPTEPINSFMYTNEIRVENNLLQLISDMNVPNYGFKTIVDWAKDAFSTGYQFNPKTTNYKSQIKQMENYSNLKPIRPFNKDVMLPNSLKDPTDTSLHKVVCCNFTSMLFSLLQDTNINGIENMVVNTKDSFSKYISDNGKLGEVHSGIWYEQAYKTMIKDPNKDFLLPIIFAMD